MSGAQDGSLGNGKVLDWAKKLTRQAILNAVTTFTSTMIGVGRDFDAHAKELVAASSE